MPFFNRLTNNVKSSSRKGKKAIKKDKYIEISDDSDDVEQFETTSKGKMKVKHEPGDTMEWPLSDNEPKTPSKGKVNFFILFIIESRIN
jgi:coenzyme F420-reducing hydrogenase beta subunit